MLYSASCIIILQRIQVHSPPSANLLSLMFLLLLFQNLSFLQSSHAAASWWLMNSKTTLGCLLHLAEHMAAAAAAAVLLLHTCCCCCLWYDLTGWSWVEVPAIAHRARCDRKTLRPESLDYGILCKDACACVGVQGFNSINQCSLHALQQPRCMLYTDRCLDMCVCVCVGGNRHYKADSPPEPRGAGPAAEAAHVQP